MPITTYKVLYLNVWPGSVCPLVEKEPPRTYDSFTDARREASLGCDETDLTAVTAIVIADRPDYVQEAYHSLASLGKAKVASVDGATCMLGELPGLVKASLDWHRAYYASRDGMTLDGVQRYLDAIRSALPDFEAAHGLEKDMWRDVLKACAANRPDCAAMAALALTSLDIEFTRAFG